MCMKSIAIKMFTTHFFTISIIAAVITNFDCATGNPTLEIYKLRNDNAAEIGDLNAPSETVKLVAPDSFSHHDEDQSSKTSSILTLSSQNAKSDVEILESRDMKEKEYEELEEQFRGPAALNINTDTFFAENIEVSPIDVNAAAIQEGHVVLSVILVVVALVSVGLYAALVIWRSHLEQRYGMRELLVNHDDDVSDQHDVSNGNGVGIQVA